jgi:hypothetical protein
MVAISGLLIFSGYQLMAYGWSQVRGANAGFFDILWPGRYVNVAAPDGGDAGIVETPTGLNDTAAGGTVGKVTPTSPAGVPVTGAGGLGSPSSPIVH